MSRVLLAGVPAALSRSLVGALGNRHRVSTLPGSVLDLATCKSATDADIIVQGLPDDTTEIELLQHASQGVWNLLTTTRATRYVLLSTMRVFDGYSDGWHLTEDWAPRPSVDTGSLAPYLAEIASREITRMRPIRSVVLRFGENANLFASASPNLVVDAVVRAVEWPEERFGLSRWLTLNIAPAVFPIGNQTRDFLGVGVPAEPAQRVYEGRLPEWPEEPAPIAGIPFPKRLAILGAGGPLGATTSETLALDHALRLSDHRSLASIAGGPPQSTGAPLPLTPVSPHEEVACDVTDPEQVVHVAAGMDTLINCTVIREDPAQAFRVNTIGAWNVMRAAATAGIPRVVHTGPALVLAPHPGGDLEGVAIRDDAPARPGDSLYLVSKYLGLEICRVFAEHHRIACPALHYIGFIDPVTAGRDGLVPASFSISWRDAGRAMAAAATVEQLPEPLTFLHILCDAPHGRFRNAKAKAILNWTPQDRLDHLWYRRSGH